MSDRAKKGSFLCSFNPAESRTNREEGNGGVTAGEHEEQRRSEDQGSTGCGAVEGKVQEAAEGGGGGECSHSAVWKRCHQHLAKKLFDR